MSTVTRRARYVVYSDLDGTLLDPRSYSCEGARLALATLRHKGVPLVFCTSKTRAEVEYWRDLLEIREPFIIENGGAIYVPTNYFPFALPDSVKRNGYQVIEFGDPYAEVVAALEAASHESGCRTVGFHQMGVAEVSIRTRLPIRQAELAIQREYDEPFDILDSGTHRLLLAIESLGKRWTRGGRFYHITGKNDKAIAVRRLTALYEQAYGSVATVGLGDGWNDVEFLKAVDTPILVRSDLVDAVKAAVPQSVVTELPGASGWNEAVMQMVATD